MEVGDKRKLKDVIEARITEGLDTDYELYKVIYKTPGHSIYQLAKKLVGQAERSMGQFVGWKKKGLCIPKKIYDVVDRF